MSKRLFLRAVLGVFLLIPLILAVLPEITALAQAPQVTSTSPQQNELNVAGNRNIMVTFDLDMDETTINASTFVVSARSTGFPEGTITYDGQTKTATFNPWEDFKVGELVTVVVTTGIQSSGGAPLENSYVWSFTVLANYGPGTFVHTNLSVDMGPWAIFCADLDEDGDIDLAAAIWNYDKVSVFLSNGNGTFGPRSDYPVNQLPFSITACDLDRDGDVDLVTGNKGNFDISVLLNNGDGTFAPRSDYPGGGVGESIFSADLDGDGDIDLATGATVLFNNGDGTFAPYSDVPAGLRVCAGDLDGDGDLDLAGAATDVSILLNNGDGTFFTDSVYPVGGGPRAIFAADLDGDGDLDLATGNQGSDDVSVLLNNGDGTFDPHSLYPVTDEPCGVTAYDLEGDGDLDLVTVSYWYDPPSLLLNNGDGTFGPYSTAIGGGMAVFAADLDNDGDMDLAAGGRYGPVTALFNQIAGDCNGDEVIDIADVVHLINYLFIDGPAPFPLPAGDANRDGTVDVGDVTYLINYLFTGA
jgi:hypothetical protein